MHRFFISIFLFVVLFFIAGCIMDSDTQRLIPPADMIERLNIPFREHGYSNFPTTIIDSPDSLQRFIAGIETQSNWNEKGAFLTVLNDSTLNLNQYTLLLFRQTEPSGSIQLSVQQPYITDGLLNVEIKRSIPSVGTADMAYYALAYKIQKSYKHIRFRIEDLPVVNITLP
jgi:hypothetical protein